MVKPELLDYINKSINAGLSKDQIVNILIDNHWSEDVINEAFSLINGSNVPQPPIKNKLQKKTFIYIFCGLIAVLFITIATVFIYKSLTEQKNNLTSDSNISNTKEQTQLAKDLATKFDASEILNAYYRYYAMNQKYPWNEFSSSPTNPNDAIFLDSTQSGFGLCYSEPITTSATSIGDCSESSINLGVLKKSNELTKSFTIEDKFWTFTSPGMDGLGIYVCYIPKDQKNRSDSSKLYCLKKTESYTEMDKVGLNSCAVLPTNSKEWDNPIFNGTAAMFACVPEIKN